MARTLLLCFVHGFKGSDNTFQRFPQDLEEAVAKELPDHRVQSVVYPKYETRGELAQCTEKFLEWLKARVMEIRKERSEKPWPPHDRDVGVILVAHSMGGFVASDTLFLALNERYNAANSSAPRGAADGENEAGEKTKVADDSKRTSTNDSLPPLFPLIQGIVAFDTPYNGLARSMFVYGAFSNYSKISSVFNVMTALAAAPAGLSRLAVGRATRSAVAKTATRSVVGATKNPGWKAWQILAVRTGTVGAIAAGGVAAYMHRREIAAGLRGVRDLDRAKLAEGYQRSLSALGQGLAYVNHGNVGRSYAWLADHFTFVGTLVKPRELERRLSRLAGLKGVGFRDVYVSLGENGYWSGGYFVPERTFCAVPEAGGKDGDNPAATLFERLAIEGVADEVEAHISVFKRDKNEGYDDMTARTAALVAGWFNSEDEPTEDPQFAPGGGPDAAAIDGADAEAEEKIRATDDGVEIADEPDDAAGVASSVSALASDSSHNGDGDDDGDDAAGTAHSQLPDESPVDIAAAASLVPLSDDPDLDGGDGKQGEREKQTYLRHLFGIAEQAGTDLRSATATWSSKLPAMEQIPRPSMPNLPNNMPSMPSLPSMPSMPKPSIPSFSIFAKKKRQPPSPPEDLEVEGGVPFGDDPVPADDDTRTEGDKLASASGPAATAGGETPPKADARVSASS